MAVMEVIPMKSGPKSSTSTDAERSIEIHHWKVS